MIKLIHSDCVAAMKDMPDCSVDSIVTDPPYELGFMGKKWDSTGIAYSVEMWEQCLRVLKPGGHLLSFSGSRTYHRMTVAIEDAGFEVRDQIMWVYGSGFPKSHNLDGDWQGWGTALKPAHEPICVARKPLIGTVADNVLAHGIGALNINGCRIGTERRPLMVRTETIVSASSMGGKSTGATSSGEFTTQGRWPANLIHDGSEEVIDRMGEPARFFYCAKASKADREAGLDGFEEVAIREYRTGNVHNGHGGRVPDKVRRNTHPTVKPTDLMRYLCRLVTPTNGIVLDPFMGSGSTGKAAKLEGFGFIGIEQNDEYIAIANARIDAAKQQTVETSETLELFA